MSLTKRMAEWVEANSARLQGLDRALFRESQDDREKPSAHLVMERGERFVDAIVWDSGEVEISFGMASEPHDEHHEVDNPAELDKLLTKLAKMVE
jgi:hypothetical protein